MHAMILELLKNHLKAKTRALDVGSGSGCFTTLMAKMMEGKGFVYGIDHLKELTELSEKNIKKSNADLLDKG